MFARIMMIAVVGALIAPSAVAGQKTFVIRTPPMVTDGDRQRPPTATEVLGEIAAVGRSGGPGPLGLPDHMAHELAVALLRQRYGPMLEAEVDALANALADLILDSVSDTDKTIDARWRARGALSSAALRPGVYVGGRYLDSLPGIPAQAAFDALVRVYETFAARALADGGTDPFVEAARRDSGTGRVHGPPRFGRDSEVYTLSRSLSDVFWADPEGTEGREGRGWSFVLDLFNRNMPPVCNSPAQETRDGKGLSAECQRSVWCEAGNLLHHGGSPLLGPHPWHGPDRDRWVRYCYENRPKQWR